MPRAAQSKSPDRVVGALTMGAFDPKSGGRGLDRCFAKACSAGLTFQLQLPIADSRRGDIGRWLTLAHLWWDNPVSAVGSRWVRAAPYSYREETVARTRGCVSEGMMNG
jgi:hypothetical protein